MHLAAISADEYGSGLSFAEDNGAQKSESEASAIVKNIRLRSIGDGEESVPQTVDLYQTFQAGGFSLVCASIRGRYGEWPFAKGHHIHVEGTVGTLKMCDPG